VSARSSVAISYSFSNSGCSRSQRKTVALLGMPLSLHTARMLLPSAIAAQNWAASLGLYVVAVMGLGKKSGPAAWCWLSHKALLGQSEERL
jgi:hypothetical protein